MPKTINFQGVPVHAPGFGAMGLSIAYGTPNEEQSKNTLRKAIEIGCTFWNTADWYGHGKNEVLIGSVLKEGDNRSTVFLVTKFGFTWNGDEDTGINGSPEYTAKAIDASLERLGFTPDAWALHRVDKNVPIEETIRAMDAARTAGKTKFIGISECSAATLRRANAVAKIDFIEVEYSPWTLDMEQNGVLDIARVLGIIVLAYSPLGRGFLTGRFTSPSDLETEGDVRSFFPRLQTDVWEHNYKLVKELQSFATKKECTAGQLSLAWLMAQGDNVIPIPGTKSEKYLIENFEAADVKLSLDDLAALRTIISENQPIGHRYMEALIGSLDG